MKLRQQSVSDWVALGQLIVACVFMAGAAQMSFGSLQKPGPAVTPFIFASILAICSVLTLLKGPKDAEPMPRGEARRTVIVVSALALSYPVALPWLGFSISTVVLVGLVAYSLKMPRHQALLLAIISVGISYLLFHLLLGVPFPGGLVGF
ncbi:MAG: tripartite tricarboxylate transporter TctB family protein [Xanthobacteraceae bacterium]